MAPKEERDPWTLPMSIFKPRAKESDARGYWDSGQVRALALALGPRLCAACAATCTEASDPLTSNPTDCQLPPHPATRRSWTRCLSATGRGPSARRSLPACLRARTKRARRPRTTRSCCRCVLQDSGAGLRLWPCMLLLRLWPCMLLMHGGAHIHAYREGPGDQDIILTAHVLYCRRCTVYCWSSTRSGTARSCTTRRAAPTTRTTCRSTPTPPSW